MSRFLLLSFSLIIVSLAAFGRAAAANQTNVLWHAQPARSWMTEALPISNGSLGGRYVWLPVECGKNDRPVLRWHAGWDLSVFARRY